MNEMLDQLMPASARYAPTVRNVIESHVLERSKIKYQPPLLTEPRSSTTGRQGVIEGSVNGGPELLGVPGDPNLPGTLPSLRPNVDDPRRLGGNIILPRDIARRTSLFPSPFTPIPPRRP